MARDACRVNDMEMCSSEYRAFGKERMNSRSSLLINIPATSPLFLQSTRFHAAVVGGITIVLGNSESQDGGNSSRERHQPSRKEFSRDNAYRENRRRQPQVSRTAIDKSSNPPVHDQMRP